MEPIWGRSAPGRVKGISIGSPGLAVENPTFSVGSGFPDWLTPGIGTHMERTHTPHSNRQDALSQGAGQQANPPRYESRLWWNHRLQFLGIMANLLLLSKFGSRGSLGSLGQDDL